MERMRARRWLWWLGVGVVAVGALAALAVWRAGTEDPRDRLRSSRLDTLTTTPPVSSPIPTAPIAPATSPAPTGPGSAAVAPPAGAETIPASALAGDGTFTVGSPYVPAGVYVSKGNASCSWQRASDGSGEPGSVIAKDNTSGEARVQLAAGEVFTTRGCSRWVFVSAN